MSNYNTNLKDWGATGSEPPDGYNYIEDEPPVDVFDNWKANNVINDIQHLVSLTNSRVETDKGTTRPSSPENAHLFADSSSGEIEWWDSTAASWSRALDATGDTMEGSLTLNSGAELDGNLVDTEGNTVYNFSANYLEQSVLQNDTVTVNAGTGISSAGSVSLGSSVTINVDDSRYILEDGDTMSGVLTLNDGSTAASRSWVDSNADVPNADYADSAGDADTVDGQHYSDIQTWVNNNADVPNADHADNADHANNADHATTADDADTIDGIDSPNLGGNVNREKTSGNGTSAGNKSTIATFDVSNALVLEAYAQVNGGDYTDRSGERARAIVELTYNDGSSDKLIASTETYNTSDDKARSIDFGNMGSKTVDKITFIEDATSGREVDNSDFDVLFITDK